MNLYLAVSKKKIVGHASRTQRSDQKHIPTAEKVEQVDPNGHRGQEKLPCRWNQADEQGHKRYGKLDEDRHGRNDKREDHKTGHGWVLNVEPAPPVSLYGAHAVHGVEGGLQPRDACRFVMELSGLLGPGPPAAASCTVSVGNCDLERLRPL